jgi:hypothetical protein
MLKYYVNLPNVLIMIEQLGNVGMLEKSSHHKHPQGLKAASKLGEYIWTDSNPV